MIINKEKEELKHQLVYYRKRYNDIYYSKTWQIFLLVKNCLIKVKKIIKGIISPSLRLKDIPEILSKEIKAANKLVLINLPLINWYRKRQRPQHLCQQFAKDNNLVFYINNHFIVELQSGLNKNQIAKKIKIRKLKERIYEVDLVSFTNLDINKDAISNLWDQQYLSWSFNALLKAIGNKKTIIKVDNPFWYILVKNLKNNCLLYDCMDELSGFWNTGSILQLEPLLAKKAKIILASSRTLLKKLKKYNKACFLVPNATEYNHFAKQTNKIPHDMQFKHPLIGYYGAIGGWFDDQLLFYLANKKPAWNFVIIGNISDPEKLQSIIRTGLDNIHILNQKTYQDLPLYLYCFDVCLIPFLINQLTKAVNPIKLFEYLSAGKPIVSTNLPEIKQYKQPYVYLAKTKKEFLEKIELALKETNKDFSHKRQELAKQNTWDIRYQQINNIISKYYE